MNVTFTCPDCNQDSRADVSTIDRALRCPHCHAAIGFPDDAFDAHGLARCLVCPSRELFVRKDFPQRLGVAIVVVGLLASCVAWYYYSLFWTFGILFATAAIDVLLYLVVGDALVCYRCGAQYRSADGLDRHKAFDLQTHERYRQQQARLEKQRH
jgi:DNA-directed RNA polymerase subunit RPC12/RpoP